MTSRSNVVSVLLAALLAAAAALPSSAGTPAAPARTALTDLAPADEYFGPTHISILEIRHRILAIKNDLHRGRTGAAGALHTAGTITDAFYDWTNRFPHDPWIARTGWELATLYEELPGQSAHDHAVALLGYVSAHFSGTKFAQSSSADLARGVGVRPWPADSPAPAHSAAPARSPAPAKPSPSPSPPPFVEGPIIDAPGLLSACLRLKSDAPHIPPGDALKRAIVLQGHFDSLTRGTKDTGYARPAWELAALYESLPGEDARVRAIQLLAALVDRYPGTIYARWSVRDLERGVGLRQ